MSPVSKAEDSHKKRQTDRKTDRHWILSNGMVVPVRTSVRLYCYNSGTQTVSMKG